MNEKELWAVNEVANKIVEFPFDMWTTDKTTIMLVNIPVPKGYAKIIDGVCKETGMNQAKFQSELFVTFLLRYLVLDFVMNEEEKRTSTKNEGFISKWAKKVGICS